MKELFAIEDFTNVILFVLNRPDFEFTKMYNTFGYNGNGYIMEKFDLARSNFPSWWCNLDPESQLNVIKYVKDFYQK